ncbi:MAG: SpoIIE family protein phosphatase, partial [Gammaproteobacteria bacterium]|nr:SpoIIE family protein phosphatase [Gammaproteobacteria bacterium]
MSDRPEDVSAEQLWQVLELSKQLSSEGNLDNVLERVVRLAREVLHADRGTVFLYDRDDNELVSRVATGKQDIRVSIETGIVGECARERKIINVPDCYADERFNQEIDRKTGYRSRCMITLPLVGLDDSLVGVLQLLNRIDGVFQPEHERVGEIFAAQCAVALQRAQWMSDRLEKEKRDRDLAIAREIQQDALPKSLPSLPDFDIAGWNRAADETGGDMYDGVPLNETSALFMLGDATGHGIGPALSVTQVRSMVHMAVRLKANLDHTIAEMNAQLCDDLAENRFVTAFLGILCADNHTLNYHSTGQGPLLLFRGDDAQTLEPSTMPLGVIDGMPLRHPQPIIFEPGDFFVVMSDGFFEYARPDGEEFGNDRVIACLARNRQKSCQEMVHE